MLIDDYKNISKLVLSNGSGQLLAFMCFPFLTRVYSIENFADYAIIFAAIMIAGSISTGKFEMAIMLPKTYKISCSLAFVSIAICTLFSIILSMCLFAFQKNFQIIGNIESILIPACIFFVGLNSIFLQLANRLGIYDIISATNFLRYISLPIIQLVMFKFEAVGLLIGLATSFLLSALILIVKINKKNKIKLMKNSKNFYLVIMRYRKFLIFTLPGDFINSINQHIVTIIMGSLFNKEVLGLYFFINRLLMLPISMLGGAISSVLYRRFRFNDANKQGTAWVFLQYLGLLLVISVFFFMFAVFLLPDLITVLFDSKWSNASKLIPILILFCCVRFVSSTLSIILSFREKNQQYFVINLFLVTLNTSIILYTLFYEIKFQDYLNIHANISTLFYGVLIIYYLKISLQSSIINAK